MANIVINKNFNKKYLYRHAQYMFTPSNTSTFSIFSLPSYGFISGVSFYSFKLPFITKESTLLTLEKISKHYNDIDRIVDGAAETDRITYLGEVISVLLYNHIGTNRELILTKLVEDGVITQTEMDDFYINEFTDKPITNVMTDDNGLMTISFTNVNKLKFRHDNAVNNTANEQLYICFMMPSTYRFHGVTSSYDSIDYNYFSASSEVTKQCLPYVAVSIGEESTNDVVLDYVGLIDYVDDFEIKVQLPKQLS